jgi:hypothetical protein
MKTDENRIEKHINTNDELLDRIAAESGCMYLSDLRGCIFKGRCRFVVAGIPATDYSVEVWEDAVYYMLGKEEKFKTAEEAKQTLLKHL